MFRRWKRAEDEEGAPLPLERLELIAAATDKRLKWHLHGEEAEKAEPVPPAPDPLSPSRIAAKPAATAHRAAQPVEPTAKVELPGEASASRRLAAAEARQTPSHAL